MPTTHTCYRCGDVLPRPVEKHAHYVRAPDTVETETVEVAAALVANGETQAAIDRLRADHYPDVDAATLTRAVVSGTDLFDYLGDPPAAAENAVETRRANARAAAPAVADFDRVEVANVADAPDGTVKVERAVEQREVQKTGLVCLDCHEPETDETIW